MAPGERKMLEEAQEPLRALVGGPCISLVGEDPVEMDRHGGTWKLASEVELKGLITGWIWRQWGKCGVQEGPRVLASATRWTDGSSTPRRGNMVGAGQRHTCVLLLCVCTRAKPPQSCLTLCEPMDCSPPGSSVHGILQARIVEWVVVPSSRDLHDPGIELVSLMPPALAGGFFTTSATCKAHIAFVHIHNWLS